MFGEGKGGGDADEGDDGLGIEGEAEGGSGEEPAEDAGDGLGKVANHGDAALVLEVVVGTAVVEGGVVKESGVGPGDEALAGAEEYLGEEEEGEGGGPGVDEGADEAGNAPDDETTAASPDVGKVAGRDVEGEHGDGVGAFEDEDVGDGDAALGVEEDNDGHDQGEPLGNLDEIEGDDVSPESGVCCRVHCEGKVRV